VRTTTNVWDIPCCNQCIGHVRAAQSASGITRSLVVLSLIGGLLLWYVVNLATAIVLGTLALVSTTFVYRILMARARALCGANCACVGISVAYLGWHGMLHQFEMASLRFVGDFMVTNRSKLVNLSPQARDLLGTMRVRATAATSS
jgi:hypothetical protein